MHFLVISPTNPWPALVCVVAALATAFALVKIFGSPPPQGRFLTIDGLRGYLALFVFLLHACCWFDYVRAGDWAGKASRFYLYLGRGSVIVFFMITGFLFFTKLIDSHKQPLDWTRLYVSRILRLAPLYFFGVMLILAIVAILSGFTLKEPLPRVGEETATWFSFTITGTPDINQVHDTNVIIAAVTWSLAYEWMFYLSLPALSLLVGKIPPFPSFALTLCAWVFGAWLLNFGKLVLLPPAWLPEFWKAAPFLGGILAAVLVRAEGFRRFASRKTSSLLALGCLPPLFFFENPFAPLPILLMTCAFIIIAGGNNIFGLLTIAPARLLGEISYGIYLLHGIVLFVAFNFVIGPERERLFSPAAHWVVVLALVPVVVLFTFATYRFIEAPSMRRTNEAAARLRARTRPVAEWALSLRTFIYSKIPHPRHVPIKTKAEK